VLTAPPFFLISTIAYGVLDNERKWDMTPQEAAEVGRRAIYQATHRDSYSGGIVHVYHVTENGWVKISADDVYNLHWNYHAQKRQ